MFSSTALGAGQLGFASKVDADISQKRDWALKENRYSNFCRGFSA
jgi:hypothetical protein